MATRNLAALGLAVSLTLHLPATSLPEGPGSADAGWARIVEAQNPLRLYASRQAFAERTTVEALPRQERVAQDTFQAAREFFLNHPDDPRRLDALALYLDPTALANFYVRTPTKEEIPPPDAPMSTRDWNRWYATTPSIVVDAAARESWLRQGEEMVGTFLDYPHGTAVQREQASVGLLCRDLFQLRKQTLGETVPDWPMAWRQLADRFALHAAEYAEVPESAKRIEFFMSVFESSIRYYQRYGVIPRETGKLAIKERWQRFLSVTDQRVQDAARAGLADLVRRENATLDDINFISLDGRKVDLRDKRGNVVLVDFWALWCRPCVEEMPFLRRLYQDYKGFTIVGINCDSAPTKTKLEEFLKTGGYDWPQHFDGKGPGNEFAVLFGVSSWPTTILVGQDGTILGRDLRGAELEDAIRTGLRTDSKQTQTN